MFRYHEQTKHSYDSVRSNPNQLDWSSQPSTYKNYPDTYPKRQLDLDKEEDNFLYHIAGLTAKKSYPGFEYYLRINPSAGALYPNELYFQARGVEGVEDGIYHYEVATHSLAQLVPISEEEGLEPYLGYTHAMEGYLFLVSAIYYRSSWKYKNRALRYCLLDAGHLLGSIEAAALLKPHAVQMQYLIEREKLNRMFGFEQREFFLSAATLAIPRKEQKVKAVEFALPYVEGSGTFEPNAKIMQAYQETISLQACHKLLKAPKFDYRSDKLRETIFARRSQRGFEGDAITKAQYSYIMERITQPILSDCDEEVSVYAVVNRVLDMPLGVQKDGEYIKYGDFSRKAGYLCLEQYSLAAKGAVTFFLPPRQGTIRRSIKKQESSDTGSISHQTILG